MVANLVHSLWALSRWRLCSLLNGLPSHGMATLGRRIDRSCTGATGKSPQTKNTTSLTSLSCIILFDTHELRNQSSLPLVHRPLLCQSTPHLSILPSIHQDNDIASLSIALDRANLCRLPSSVDGIGISHETAAPYQLSEQSKKEQADVAKKENAANWGRTSDLYITCGITCFSVALSR
ncbi:hypothetical protein VUR80DRAFT_5646 [Thermomyces stellatus]